jgi:OOP family OmpA-OmpF porin
MKALLASGLFALALLCVLCPSCRAPAIEEEVRGASITCAEQAGLDPGLISVSGRDVTLSGLVESEALSLQLMNCIAALPSTRIVNNQLSVLAAGALGFVTQYGDITISGVVPGADAKTAIIEHAETLWGADNVTDGLDIDPKRSIGGWSGDDFAQFLDALHYSRRDLDIELSGGLAVVGGTVLSNLAKVRVLGGAVALLPGFEVVDRLSVRQPMTLRETLQVSLDNQLDGRVVEFETDSANLAASGRQVLDGVIKILRENPGRIEISGHTDSAGPTDHNLELSQRRAEAVENYFVSKGLETDRFEVVGFGPTRPIASNATPEGQQMNRRTEFHALKEN